MNKSKIDKERLLKKFKTLSVASICIQKTSKYLYQFYKSSDSIVNVWLEALNSVCSDPARVSLFYIANEMLQSKNYGSDYFKQSWKPHLAHSIECIKESSVKDKIRRILNIWIERKVYEKSFVDDLINRLTTSKSPVINDDDSKDIIMNFDPEEAMEKLKDLITAENKTTEILKEHESLITFDEKVSREEMKKLKDKNHCNTFSDELDVNINHLFQICNVLEEELRFRQIAIEAINNAEIYYDTQQKETLTVEDAYRRYGNLILKTKVAIEDRLEFLMDGSGPFDLDDAPSPGNTPPHLYDDVFKTAAKDSPLSYDDAVSPSQSMDMSEDDTPVDKSGYLDKPYSPSSEIQSSKREMNEEKTSLSSTEALQLLTSVFSQSLTKKPCIEMNTKIHLQSDIFRNTLTTPVKSTSEEIKTIDQTDKSSTVFADAFRLISNLTGLKNITERTTHSDTSVGTTIPTLTSKSSSFNIAEEFSESNNQSPFLFNPTTNMITSSSTGNNDNNVSLNRLLYPDHQMGNFPPPNPLYPIFSNSSVPPPPMLFSNNPPSYTITSCNQSNRQSSQSPGSCTDDEGGDTPTQDEPASLNSNVSQPIFNQSLLPGLSNANDELNKHIQNAINAVTNSYGMQGQFPFNNMPIQFPLMNASPQIQPLFNPVSANNCTAMFGPPRAIRTKRPTIESHQEHNVDLDDNDSMIDDRHGSPPPPPPPSSTLSSQQQQRPQSASSSTVSDAPVIQEQETMNHSDNVSKQSDNESDLINLYGDVEEELDRNFLMYQQSINVRNSRPPPPPPAAMTDRYHLYNNSHMEGHTPYNNGLVQAPPPQSMGGRGRINYQYNNNNHSIINNGNSQHHRPSSIFPGRAGHQSYYPNRSTTFRPKNNQNMFH